MARRVSAREASDAERLLQDLVRRGANRYCADCGDRSPNHVVLSLGTFVCAVCAGVHRDAKRAGVRSLDSATFSMDDAYRMEDRGNELARKRWMARWSPRDFPEPKPGDTVAIREFIWLKYDGSWASRAMIPAGSTRASRPPLRGRERHLDRSDRDRDSDLGRGSYRGSDREYDFRRFPEASDRARNDRQYHNEDRYERDRSVRRIDDQADSEDERRRRKNKKNKKNKKSKKAEYDSNESGTETEDSVVSEESDSRQRKNKKKSKDKKAKKGKTSKPAFAGSIEDLIQQNNASTASSSTLQSFGTIVQTPIGPAVVTPQGLMHSSVAAQMMGTQSGMGVMSGLGVGMPAAPVGINNFGASGFPGVNGNVRFTPEPAPLALPAPVSAGMPDNTSGISASIQTLNISDSLPSRPGSGVSSMGMNSTGAFGGGVSAMNGFGPGRLPGDMTGNVTSGAVPANNIIGTLEQRPGALGAGFSGVSSPTVTSVAADASNPFSGGSGSGATSKNPFDDFSF